jgi:hypothetical protein
MHTHFTTATAGQPAGSTWWAPVISSPPVTAALLAELAACSRQLGAWTAQLSRAGSLHAGLPAGASQGLRAASRWLRAAANSVPAARRLDPPAAARRLDPPAAGRRLLLGMPAGFPPPRQPPTDAEPVPELCAGITVTTERLRHAARTFAGQGSWSPAANSVSWRRHALAWAITGAYHGQDISPVAAEADDLVLRTGRLAYHNPRWTPDRADVSPARDPADLAATASYLKVALGAVHHATDAISRIAACDTDAVRDAASVRPPTSPAERTTAPSSDLKQPDAQPPGQTLFNMTRHASRTANRGQLEGDSLVTSRAPGSAGLSDQAAKTRVTESELSRAPQRSC